MSGLKVSEGYSSIEDEFEASLWRAFNDGKTDYVALHNRRNRFLWGCAEYGVSRGWLKEGKLVELDQQSTEVQYWLTDEGREYFVDKASMVQKKPVTKMPSRQLDLE